MNATREEWRPIPDWEGVYEVSDQGRVRSLSRIITSRNGRPYSVRGSILIGSAHKFGYRKVLLCRDNTARTANVHSLVLLAFVGPLPEGYCTRHLNGDPTDNRLVNLEYGTVSENMRDKRRHGTNPQVNKTHCPQGHEYTPENTLYMARKDRPNPSRCCRECNRQNCQRRYAASLK